MHCLRAALQGHCQQPLQRTLPSEALQRHRKRVKCRSSVCYKCVTGSATSPAVILYSHGLGSRLDALDDFSACPAPTNADSDLVIALQSFKTIQTPSGFRAKLPLEKFLNNKGNGSYTMLTPISLSAISQWQIAHHAHEPNINVAFECIASDKPSKVGFDFHRGASGRGRPRSGRWPTAPAAQPPPRRTAPAARCWPGRPGMPPPPQPRSWRSTHFAVMATPTSRTSAFGSACGRTTSTVPSMLPTRSAG